MPVKRRKPPRQKPITYYCLECLATRNSGTIGAAQARDCECGEKFRVGTPSFAQEQLNEARKSRGLQAITVPGTKKKRKKNRKKPGGGGSAKRKKASRRQPRTKYEQYLASDLWRKIRNRVLARDGKKCRACGRRASIVHHMSYHKEVMDGINDGWLVSLCRKCHDHIEFKEVDGERVKVSLAEANHRLEDRIASLQS